MKIIKSRIFKILVALFVVGILLGVISYIFVAKILIEIVFIIINMLLLFG